MAVVVVANHGQSYGPGQTVTTGNIPSYTPREGDIIVLFISSQGATIAIQPNSSLPAGWVNPLGDGVEVVSDAHGCGVVYHVVTAAEQQAGTINYSATNVLTSNQTGEAITAVLRGVMLSDIVDAFNTAFASGNTVTPHVLPSLAGANLQNNSLVLSFVAKDGNGTYTTPGTHTLVHSRNSFQGVWLGRHNTLTTAGNNVTAVNITPSGGDEYASISLAFTNAPGLPLRPRRNTTKMLLTTGRF
jgi:hypothetical protein